MLHKICCHSIQFIANFCFLFFLIFESSEIDECKFENKRIVKKEMKQDKVVNAERNELK